MVSFDIGALLGFILTYVLLSGSRARRLSLSLLGALGGGAVNFLIIPPPMVFSSP